MSLFFIVKIMADGKVQCDCGNFEVKAIPKNIYCIECDKVFLEFIEEFEFENCECGNDTYNLVKVDDSLVLMCFKCNLAMHMIETVSENE